MCRTVSGRRRPWPGVPSRKPLPTAVERVAADASARAAAWGVRRPAAQSGIEPSWPGADFSWSAFTGTNQGGNGSLVLNRFSSSNPLRRCVLSGSTSSSASRGRFRLRCSRKEASLLTLLDRGAPDQQGTAQLRRPWGHPLRTAPRSGRQPLRAQFDPEAPRLPWPLRRHYRSAAFFPWYNTEHRHAGIAMLYPR